MSGGLNGADPVAEVIDGAAKSGRGRKARRAAPAAVPPVRDGTEAIRVIGGTLHLSVAAATAALGRRGTVYKRGGVLVRLARLPAARVAGGARHPQGALVIVMLDRPNCRVELTAAVGWEKFNRRSVEWVPIDAPPDIADAVIGDVGGWGPLPPLWAVVEAPTLRQDGSVIDQPGYDVDSGIYFDPGGTRFPRIPVRPSRDEALAALATLKAILAGFPFANDAARSAAIAEIITALVRRVLRSAPIFGHSAPRMGSGKSLLACLPAYIATGRAPVMMSFAADPETDRKRMLSILLEGPGVIVLDNIERDLGGDALCSVITEPTYTDRVLGLTRTVTVPTNVTWIATGNNLTFSGDLTSRALLITLDAEVERPEEREFAVDLHQDVPARRGELATAALTIVRAYLAAGAPAQPVKRFGRFEAWERWCRLPLVWLGEPDPCDTRLEIEEFDPVRGLLRPLLEAWGTAYSGREMTLREVISSVTPDGALDRALRQIGGDGDAINTRRVGKFIRRHLRRIEGGWRFEAGPQRDHVQTWIARRVLTEGVTGGFGGLSPSIREIGRNPAKYVEGQGLRPETPHNPADDPAEVTLNGEAEA